MIAMKSRPVSIFSAMFMMVALLLSGCGGKTEAPATEKQATEGQPAGENKPTAITQVVNWFPQPEHGGQYAALSKGFYKEKGIEMTIMPGGPQVSTTQIVASGKAQFGMVQADELLLARENGIPLVALATVFQTNPQGVMVHKGQNINSLADLNGHKMFVQSGATYWEYLKKKYSYSDVKEMVYTGSLTGFVSDPASAIQCFVSSEPFDMKKQNVDVDVKLIADDGYNPYSNVLVTTEQYLKENPDTVKAFLEASVKGWEYYKDNYKEINPVIQAQNKDTPLEKMEFTDSIVLPMMFGGDAETHGFGYMSKERWQTLAQQLTELGILKSMPDVSQVFTVDYLPKK